MAGGKDPSGTRARGRPYASGYGIPSDPAGMLSWDRVEGHLTEARNYWVATVRPDGRPHVTPVWGLWVGEAFYFGAELGSRKARNLVENPNVVVHLESGDDVVIVEGGVEVIVGPDPRLVERLVSASVAKYGVSSDEVEGSYAVRPRVAFAWSHSGPRTFTRWMFDH